MLSPSGDFWLSAAVILSSKQVEYELYILLTDLRCNLNQIDVRSIHNFLRQTSQIFNTGIKVRNTRYS